MEVGIRALVWDTGSAAEVLRPTRPGDRILIEVVGLGGSGKSSVVAELERSGMTAIRVGEHRRLVARGRAALAALQLALRHRLPPARALSLFRRCCSVETGFCLIATAPAGPVVIDDGPVRTLHDTQCRSYRERAAWWDYGKQALVRLGQFRTPVLLVDWHIDDRLRMQRWRSRGATTDRRRGVLPTVMVRLLDALTGHQRLAPVPANGRAVRAFMRKHLPHVSQLTVDATAADTPGEIAERIIRLLESAPIGQHDKQAPAG